MTAMLLSVATVEAYCNLLIEAIDPATFALERREFRGTGLRGKIEWVARRVYLPVYWGIDPFKTFGELKDFRDFVMHAKPDRYSGIREHADESEIPFFEPGRLERDVTTAKRKHAMTQIEDLCERIHQKVLVELPHDHPMKSSKLALKGITQIQTRLTRRNS